MGNALDQLVFIGNEKLKMSGHEIDQHIKSLADICEIMTAMRNLSKIEIHRLTRMIEAQNQLVTNIYNAANDFLSFNTEFIKSDSQDQQILLMLGSERGFCGNINERVLSFFQSEISDKRKDIILLPVGFKLQNKLQNDSRVFRFLPGASAVEEIQRILTDIIATLRQIHLQHRAIQINVIHMGLDQYSVQLTKVLPAFSSDLLTPVSFVDAPYSYLENAVLFEKLLDEFVFAKINSILYSSFMIENQRRNQHLSVAVNHLAEKIARLRQKRSEVRQEEITEEIEVIMLGSDFLMEK